MSAIGLIHAQTARVRGLYRGWWIVALAFYSQLITVASGGYVFGVLILGMQRDLGWSQAALFLPLTINRWISGLLAIPLGPVVDRRGSRGLMTASAILAGIGLIGVSLSHDAWVFYGSWALFGIAQPGLGLLGPRVVVANWFVRKRSKAFVISTLGTSAAGIVAVPAAAYLAATLGGWRAVWMLLGILSILTAPFAWWIIRRRPEDVGLLPDGDGPLPAEGAPHPAAAGATGGAHAATPIDRPWTVREALRTRSFWCVTIGFLLVSMPTSSIFLVISPYVQSYGFTPAFGAIVTSAYAFGSLGARPLWGFFLDRVGLHRTLVVFAATYAGAITVFSFQSAEVTLFAAALFLGFGISGSQLLNAQVLPDYFGRRIVGSLTGFSTLANVAVGGSAPQITAFARDHLDTYQPAFLFFAGACVVAAVTFMFATPPVHHTERAERAIAP